MTTKSDQYHYVYKIIQLSTQREYIGIHSTSDFNDGYMGSGTLIAPAVEENPSDFIKTIIWIGTSREQIEEIEASLVTEEYLLANFPEKTFNQVPGGKISLGVVSKWNRILYPGNNPGRTGTNNGYQEHFTVPKEVYEAGINSSRALRTVLSNVIKSGEWPEVLVQYKEQYREVFENSAAIMDFEEFISWGAAEHCISGTLSQSQQKIIDGLVYDKKSSRFVVPKEPVWWKSKDTSQTQKVKYCRRKNRIEEIGPIESYHEMTGLTQKQVVELSLREFKDSLVLFAK